MMREWKALWRDRWGMALALWLPLFTMLIAWWTLSGAIVRELPIGLIDLDNSTMSRQFARELDASSSFNLNHQFSTVAEGATSLRGGEIYALVVIPRHFERDIRLGTSPTITAWNNGQFVLIAKVINSALSLVAGTFNGQIAVVQALSQGAAVPEAKGLAVPIGGQITALFNQNANYAQFLLNAIIPSIWSVLLALYGLNTLAREDRHGSRWIPENHTTAISSKFLTHWLIGWAWGGIWSYGLYSLLNYPLNGSPLLLLISIGLTAGACVALGMAFYALIRDPARAVSIVGALMAPGLAFMGITFPAAAMETFATFWRQLLPVAHYGDISIAITSYGAGIAQIAPALMALALFWLLLPLTLWRYRPGNKEATC
ncbi:ABC transporter permease [Pectobacterium atrosepticum]|uniref:ABC transporter permease n=1 Tax=Pectobacterium atrosepticum TaxID=29471 RepID=UPI00049A4BEF|nr:ABC transporter permease [Pectobacterium atrosepticum]GKV85917.1 multidrug ABC transporter permease [Pectobacterium carotovorum subsp. carotovorum]AIA69426.1 multidrug ABC transporter permease [Pectobacterium atrosepticum]AIK12329.1 putative membrane protein [Pectobacterium atrosepticum]KFX15729.1 multidrug ABC transporter permease [Pectobacterium atrosepticum]KMK79923.1 ABC-type multidrug transport system, permease component [Pectobacterium atrosepticum ICMP 1526]